MTLKSMMGKDVIVRTYSAGVWFGTLSEKDGNEVILTNARRLYWWHAAESITLSAVAKYGLNHKESTIAIPIESVWLEAIEILPCTDIAIASIKEAPDAKAK